MSAKAFETLIPALLWEQEAVCLGADKRDIDKILVLLIGALIAVVFFQTASKMMCQGFPEGAICAFEAHRFSLSLS